MRALRSQKLDLRVTPAAKALLVEAAALSRRSVSDFVLDSALTRAEEAMVERRSFKLDDERWQRFVAALDAPTARDPALGKLMARPDRFAATDSR
jgi:uncharacterized protein (DUF1778 family)